MDLATPDLHQAAREHLLANGIDPDIPQQRAAFDLAEHMVANAMQLLEARVPRRFAQATVEDPTIRSWVDVFLRDPESAPSLFLRGPVGAGKTWQAFGAVRAAVLGCARNRRRLQWRVTTHPAFNAAMRPSPDDSHKTDLEDLQQTGLLLLDELGAGQATNWTEDTLHRLVDYRWSQEKPTIFTTNFDRNELADRLDERVLSRLKDSVQVAVKHADRRAPRSLR